MIKVCLLFVSGNIGSKKTAWGRALKHFSSNCEFYSIVKLCLKCPKCPICPRFEISLFWIQLYEWFSRGWLKHFNDCCGWRQAHHIMESSRPTLPSTIKATESLRINSQSGEGISHEVSFLGDIPHLWGFESTSVGILCYIGRRWQRWLYLSYA